MGTVLTLEGTAERGKEEAGNPPACADPHAPLLLTAGGVGGHKDALPTKPLASHQASCPGCLINIRYVARFCAIQTTYQSLLRPRRRTQLPSHASRLVT